MPTLAELFDRAVRLHRAGNLAQAESLYRQVLQANPAHAHALHFLGVLAHQTGRHQKAIELIRQAIQCNPNVVDFHFNLGTVFRDQGLLTDAIQSYRQALTISPNHAGTLNNLGSALMEQGEFAEATACLRQAVQSNPNDADAQYNLGTALVAQGRLADAAGCFRQALRCNPNHVDAHYNLANSYRDLGQVAEAISCYRQAVRLNPDHAHAHNNLGNALFGQGKFDEAAACCREALRINPNYAEAVNNLGSVFLKQKMVDDAIECFRKALAINPNYAEAHYNLGMAYAESQNFAGAAECYQQAIAIDSRHPSALWNLSLLRMLQGDLAGGWPGFEQRCFQPGRVPRSLPQPRWDGSPLEGKTILLYAEQGLGDTIQFIRFAEMVKNRGGRVLVECQPPLVRLLTGIAGVDQVVPHGRPLPEHDVQIPLLSLGGIFQTSLATIPAKVPYLRADPDAVTRWRNELKGLDGMKIGIVWQGNPTQMDDRDRSVPLAQLAPLAEVPGVRLLSLQVGTGREQLTRAPFPVTDLGSRFDPNSLDDLAAVLVNLDLVVTVCTSVAHLAGALGVPGLVALKLVPYWCWHLDRSVSPWYPTLRLFRQNRRGDWSDVFKRITAEVRSR